MRTVFKIYFRKDSVEVSKMSKTSLFKGFYHSSSELLAPLSPRKLNSHEMKQLENEPSHFIIHELRPIILSIDKFSSETKNNEMCRIGDRIK